MARSAGRPAARSFSRPVARSFGRPVARSFGRPLARSFGRPLARSFGIPLERGNLFVTELAELAGLQAIVRDRADSHAAELHDGVTDRVAHLSHLAIPSLVNHEREDGLRSSGCVDRLADAHLGGRGPAAVDLQAPLEPSEQPRLRNPPHAHFVLARYAMPRMGEPRGEIAVAREEQQPLGVVVEAAYRIDVIVDATAGDEIDHRRTPLRIRSAGDVSARFVEQDVSGAAGRLDPSAVDADVVNLRVRLRAELGDRRAVDADPSLRDERFRRAARRDARGGQDFLEAGGHRDWIWLRWALGSRL